MYYLILNRTKLLYTMIVLDLDKGLLHWEMRRRLFHDAIVLVHSFKHSLYVVTYGDTYLAGETLSRVYNYIPCMLRCKQGLLTRLYGCFCCSSKKNQQNSPMQQVYGMSGYLQILSILKQW
jgi:hypothetical protein